MLVIFPLTGVVPSEHAFVIRQSSASPTTDATPAIHRRDESIRIKSDPEISGNSRGCLSGATQHQHDPIRAERVGGGLSVRDGQSIFFRPGQPASC